MRDQLLDRPGQAAGHVPDHQQRESDAGGRYQGRIESKFIQLVEGIIIGDVGDQDQAGFPDPLERAEHVLSLGIDIVQGAFDTLQGLIDALRQRKGGGG